MRVTSYSRECSRPSPTSSAGLTRPGSRVAVVPVNDDHNMAPLSLGLLSAYAQELDGGRLQDRYDFVPLFLADEHTLRSSGPNGRRSSCSRTTSGTSSATSSSRRCSRRRTRRTSRSTAGRAHRSTPATARQFFADASRTSTSRYEARARPRSPHCSTRSTRSMPRRPVEPRRRRRPELPRRGRGRRTPRIATASPTSTRSRRRTCSGSSSRSAARTSRQSSSRTAVARTAARSATGARRHSPGSGSSTSIASRPSSSGSRRTSCCSCRSCDANFGIFERDVEIAEHIADDEEAVRLPEDRGAELREEHDEAPATDHRRLRERGPRTIEPTVAVQSMDETTLKTIRRSNIKTEKYDELADRVPPRADCASRPTS